MKKIIVIALCLLMVCGCANQTKEQIKGEQPKETNAVVDHKQQEIKASSNSLVQLSGRQNSGRCMTENGLYHIVMNDENDAFQYNIRYIDFANKKDIYLCNKPECNHKGETCDSYLNAEIGNGEASIFTDGTSLFVLTYPSDKEGSVVTGGDSDGILSGTVEEQPTALYQMNLDGSDRKKVYEFEAGESLGEYVFYDGENLVFLVKQVTALDVESGGAYGKADKKQIVRISLKDYSRENVVDIDPRMNVIGCYEQSVILAQSEYDSKYAEKDIMMNDDVWKAASKTEIVHISQVNLATKEKKNVIDIKGEGYKSYTCANGVICYSVQGSGAIHQVNLASGEDSTLCQTNFELIAEQWEDCLLCQSYDLKDSDAEILIKLSDGTSKDMKLLISDGFPVIIAGENSQYYLVETGLEGDGMPPCALITKEDFMNQQANYQEIQMIKEGRECR